MNNTLVTGIMIVSIVIQFTTAMYALWLIRITGFHYSWVFISVSLLLMGTRRLVPLLNSFFDHSYKIDATNESLALLISIGMLCGVLGIGVIFVESKTAEQKVRSLLSEKETLIRELYHRTKNTMQVIRGMVALQGSEYPENLGVQELVKTTVDRIQVISLVHQKLFNSQDLSHINIRGYVNELTELIRKSYGFSEERLILTNDVDDMRFLLDTAVPIGLILNELVTNSLKHAFVHVPEPRITISIKNQGAGTIVLKYSDNGVGVADGFDFRGQSTLGLKLVHDIGERQLSGTVDMKNESGVVCTIAFKNNLYLERV